MEEWICLNCRRIFSAGSSYAKCCGEIKIFDPKDHANLIIGMSNSWVAIDEKIRKAYEKHPTYKRVWKEHTDMGNYGSSSIFIDFVDALIEEIESK